MEVFLQSSNISEMIFWYFTWIHLVKMVSPLKKKKVFIYFIYLFILNRKALEDLGIPCFLGGMSRGLLGKDSPIHIRQNRRDALKEADVVVLAGQANIVSFLFQNDKKRNNILRPTYLILILYSKENYAG